MVLKKSNIITIFILLSLIIFINTWSHLLHKSTIISNGILFESANNNRWINLCDNTNCTWINYDNSGNIKYKFNKLISAHQGWGNEQGENINKIKKAKENGLFSVEIDVRYRKDGTAVLSHDYDSNLEYKGATTFEEALKYVSNNGMTMMVELKDEGNEEKIENIVKLTNKYKMSNSIKWWSFRTNVLKTLADKMNKYNISNVTFSLIDTKCIKNDSGDNNRLKKYYCSESDSVLLEKGYNKQQIAKDVYDHIKKYNSKNYYVFIPGYTNNTSTNKSDKQVSNTETRDFPGVYKIINYYNGTTLLGQMTCNGTCTLKRTNYISNNTNNDLIFSGWTLDNTVINENDQYTPTNNITNLYEKWIEKETNTSQVDNPPKENTQVEKPPKEANDNKPKETTQNDNTKQDTQTNETKEETKISEKETTKPIDKQEETKQNIYSYSNKETKTDNDITTILIIVALISLLGFGIYSYYKYKRIV